MSPPDHANVPGTRATSRRENVDEPVGTILLVAGALLLIVIAVIFISRGLLFHAFGPPEPAEPLPVRPAARLEPRPELRLEQFRRQKLQGRDSYGWVDRDAGVARIPVDRAMSLLVDRHASATPAGNGKKAPGP